MSHSDQVTKLPKNFEKIASSTNSKFCIIQNKYKNFLWHTISSRGNPHKKWNKIIKKFLIFYLQIKKKLVFKKTKRKNNRRN